MSKEKLKPIYWLKNYLSINYGDGSRYFLGQVLTIIDASISDKEQRKAIKNLIQNKFYDGNPNREMIEIIFDYCKKYCPDTLPEEARTSAFLKRTVNEITGQEDPVPEWDFEK